MYFHRGNVHPLKNILEAIAPILRWAAILTLLFPFLFPAISYGGIIDIRPEKTLYTAPEPIYLIIKIGGLEAKRPVNVSLSLDFPDGNTVAFLGLNGEFSPDNPLFVLDSWPFRALNIKSGSFFIRLSDALSLSQGVYTIRSAIYDAETMVLLDKSSAQFTIVKGPYLDHISPSKGVTGDVVSIYGDGFGQEESQVKVFIGGREATIMEITNDLIKTWVPYGAVTGAVKVVVGGVESNEASFQVGPYIESLSATTVAPGSALTISGFNFSTDKNKNIVVFNGIRGTVTAASETQLSVLVPDGNTGPLTITANDMESASVEVTISPVVTSIEPPRGKSGDIVTIVGRNFSPTITNNYVLFNAGSQDAFAATIIDATTTQLTVRVPDADSGTVKVFTGGEEAAGDIAFTYPPSIESISPEEVLVGDSVTITGRNFDPTAQKNMALLGDGILTITSSSANEIIARVPLDGQTGEVRVIVNDMETDEAVALSVAPIPIIRSVSPATVAEGDTLTTITVTGVGFVNGLLMYLKDEGGATISIKPSVKDYNRLTFKLPRDATKGEYGLYVRRDIAGRILESLSYKFIVD